MKDNSSFATWQTEYFSDANYSILADTKCNKQEMFAEMDPSKLTQ
jgi:hypothetical protein